MAAELLTKTYKLLKVQEQGQGNQTVRKPTMHCWCEKADQSYQSA